MFSIFALRSRFCGSKKRTTPRDLGEGLLGPIVMGCALLFSLFGAACYRPEFAGLGNRVLRISGLGDVLIDQDTRNERPPGIVRIGIELT